MGEDEMEGAALRAEIGVPGLQPDAGVPPAPPASAPMAPPPTAVDTKAPAAAGYGSAIGNRGYLDMGGINQAKLDSGHDSPKYRVLRTLSNFDPSQGVTPEVLAALNSLGLGTVTGGKDKFSFSGQVDPRLEGYTDVDAIVGFNDPNKPKAWGYGASNPNAPTEFSNDVRRRPAGPGMESADMANLAPSAFSAQSPTDSNFFTELMRQLQEQSGGIDGAALRSLL